MGSPYREGSVALADGRRVAYAEFGDPDGAPVLVCHASPSSRLEHHLPDGDGYRRLGIRLIGVDRPGSGGSDGLPGRRVVDWPDDAEQVLDALGVGRVGLLALSAGFPFALALARAVPDRVHRVAAVGASPPPDVPWPWPPVPAALRSLLLRPGPVSTATSLPLLGPAAAWPPLLARFFQVRLGPPDRALLGRPAVRAALEGTFAEGLRQGWRPAAHDRSLLRRPWGFPVSDVPRPVRIWHGRADWQAPLPGALLLAAMLPDARVRVVPRAGHLLAYSHAAEILADLTAP